MSDTQDRRCLHRSWSRWPVAARAAIVAAGIVAVPGLIALFGALTMWLWNWLMPAVFRLPTIGFWQALGILVLCQILFKGGHAARAGQRGWKRRQVWKHMREDAPESPEA